MSEREPAQFRATAGAYQALGITPREALDSLLALLPDREHLPIVICPYNHGDAFFTQEHQDRLQELKGRQDTLTEAERDEWERLVEASFEATIARTRSLPLVKS